MICLLGFSAFLRIDEVLNIRVKDIAFFRTYMAITIPKCKNDQTREGNCIYVAEIQSRYCPVFHTASYIHALCLQPEHYIVCKLVRTRKGHRAVGSHRMSDSQIRKNFTNTVNKCFPNVNLGLHSMRSGGASAAAKHNVSDRLISKHGRWASVKSRDGYIKDSVENRLHVTKNLGL